MFIFVTWFFGASVFIFVVDITMFLWVCTLFEICQKSVIVLWVGTELFIWSTWSVFCSAFLSVSSVVRTREFQNSFQYCSVSPCSQWTNWSGDWTRDLLGAICDFQRFYLLCHTRVTIFVLNLKSNGHSFLNVWILLIIFQRVFFYL